MYAAYSTPCSYQGNSLCVPVTRIKYSQIVVSKLLEAIGAISAAESTVCDREPGACPPLDLPWAHRRRSTSLHGIRRRTAWRLTNSKNTSSFLVKILIHATHFNGGLDAVPNSQTFTALYVTYSRFQVHVKYPILYFLSLIKFIRFSSSRREDIFGGGGYHFSSSCQPPAQHNSGSYARETSSPPCAFCS